MHILEWMSFPIVSPEVTKQGGCGGHTPRSTTTWWFPSETSPEAAGKMLLAASPPRAAPWAVTAAWWQSSPLPLFCRRNWVKRKRKKGKIIWGSPAAPAEHSGAICRDVSGNQVRTVQSGGVLVKVAADKWRLRKCSCSCLSVTLGFVKFWPSRLYFGATPGAGVYLAWKLWAWTRKWFGITEIT